MVTITTRASKLIIISDGFRTTIGKPILTKESVIKPISSFIEDIVKEVKRKPKSMQKRFLKTLQKTIILILPMSFTMKAHAQIPVNFPILGDSPKSDIIPSEIMEILMSLIFGAGALAVALAILCLIVGGIYGMLGQSEQSHKMSVNAIKGLGQVLLAPIIILILATLASLVFKNVDGLENFF